MAHGATRLNPPFWRHDRHVLANLRQQIVDVIAAHRLTTPGHCVVDLGCGDTPYRPLFEAAGCRYVGCDLDGSADVLIRSGEPTELADGAADVVVSFQVLEHVWDLDWYLGECRRLLKPGGWLLLSTHGSWLYHPHPTDYRRWTRDGLVSELRERGFEVDDVRAVVGPLAWSTQLRLLGYAHVLSRIPWLGAVILAPLAGLMNARMVLEDALTPRSIRDVNASVYVTLSRKL
jgi:SAM-dependent methyltransferase